MLQHSLCTLAKKWYNFPLPLDFVLIVKHNRPQSQSSHFQNNSAYIKLWSKQMEHKIVSLTRSLNKQPLRPKPYN